MTQEYNTKMCKVKNILAGQFGGTFNNSQIQSNCAMYAPGAILRCKK